MHVGLIRRRCPLDPIDHKNFERQAPPLESLAELFLNCRKQRSTDYRVVLLRTSEQERPNTTENRVLLVVAEPTGLYFGSNAIGLIAASQISATRRWSDRRRSRMCALKC